MNSNASDGETGTHYQLSREEYLAGLRYARMIQLALMPDDPYLKSLDQEVFVLNKPRDILGGDFFFVHRRGIYTYLAVGDCTGHGVPGALLSILGLSILKELMNQRCTPRANRILNQMREMVLSALAQAAASQQAYDSIDFALCIINRETGDMQYSGANRPLVRVRNGTISEWKPDKMTIGVAPLQEQSFSRQNIKLKKGDTFYLFSDGYPDQFNWKTSKKLKYRPFLQILQLVSDQPMHQQKEFLEEYMLAWKGKSLQIDDVMILGFRI